MKKIILLGILMVLLVTPAFAFLYDIKMLPKEEIAALTNQELEEVYIDAKIEEEASREFHVAAGFSSSKDYDSRKKLLRYLFDLRREISHREGMKLDEIDGSLK